MRAENPNRLEVIKSALEKSRDMVTAGPTNDIPLITLEGLADISIPILEQFEIWEEYHVNPDHEAAPHLEHLNNFRQEVYQQIYLSVQRGIRPTRDSLVTAIFREELNDGMDKGEALGIFNDNFGNMKARLLKNGVELISKNGPRGTYYDIPEFFREPIDTAADPDCSPEITETPEKIKQEPLKDQEDAEVVQPLYFSKKPSSREMEAFNLLREAGSNGTPMSIDSLAEKLEISPNNAALLISRIGKKVPEGVVKKIKLKQDDRDSRVKVVKGYLVDQDVIEPVPKVLEENESPDVPAVPEVDEEEAGIADDPDEELRDRTVRDSDPVIANVAGEKPAEPKTLKDFIITGKRLPDSAFQNGSKMQLINNEVIRLVESGLPIIPKEICRLIFQEVNESNMSNIYGKLSILLKRYSAPPKESQRRGRPRGTQNAEPDLNEEIENVDEEDENVPETDELEIERTDEEAIVDSLPTSQDATIIDRETAMPDFDRRQEADVARAERELEKGVTINVNVKKIPWRAPNGYKMELLPDDAKVLQHLLLGLTATQIGRLVHPGLPPSEQNRQVITSVSRISEQYSLANYSLDIKMAPDRKDFSYEVRPKSVRPTRVSITRADVEALRPPTPTVAERAGIKPNVRYQPGNINPYVKLELNNGISTGDLLTDRNMLKMIQAYFELRATPTVEEVKKNFGVYLGKDFYPTFNDLNEKMAAKWKLVFKLESGKQGPYLRLNKFNEGDQILKLEEPVVVETSQNPGFKVNHAPARRAEVEDTTRMTFDELRERDQFDPRRVEGDPRIYMWMVESLLPKNKATLLQYVGVTIENPISTSVINVELARNLNSEIESLGFRVVENISGKKVVSTYLKKLY